MRSSMRDPRRPIPASTPHKVTRHHGTCWVIEEHSRNFPGRKEDKEEGQRGRSEFSFLLRIANRESRASGRKVRATLEIPFSFRAPFPAASHVPRGASVPTLIVANLPPPPRSPVPRYRLSPATGGRGERWDGKKKKRSETTNRRDLDVTVVTRGCCRAA